MGAAKNIWGGISGLFSKAKSETKVVKSAVKTLDSNSIKTTSKTLGSSEKFISGGQSTLKSSASSFAKGVGSTANVGGKVFGATGILGGVSLAGAKIYDYLGDTFAITTAQREYENQIKLAGQEADVTKKAQDNYIDYLKKLADLRADGQDSSVLGASGGALGSDLFPLQEAAAEASGNKNIMWYAILGIVVIGAGTYVYSKKLKGGKN